MKTQFTTTNIHTFPNGLHTDTLAPLNLMVREAVTRADGKHSDGGNRSWRFQYQWFTKREIINLGAVKRPDGRGKLSLADARTRAKELRLLVDAGKDPRITPATATPVTFAEDMLAYHRSKSSGDSWSDQWAKNWLGSMNANVIPHIGQRVTRSLERQDIADVFRPIWATKHQTASWLLGAVENVIDKAIFSRQTEFAGFTNPVPGVAEHMLDEVRVTVDPHPSVPWQDAPALYATLAAMEDRNSRAVMLTVLTGARAAEIIGLRWGEIERAHGDVIIIPSERVKSGREHLLPLSAEALRIIAELEGDTRHDPNGFVFPGRQGKMVAGEFVPFSGGAHRDAMQNLLRDTLGLPWHIHGFRSTWRTFVSDHNPSLAEDRACEFQLDHKIQSESAVRGAYDRSLLHAERRKLLDEWAAYLTT